MLVRPEPDVNFNWGNSSPDGGIEGDTFSARFFGLVQPRYSQTYTFHTYTDDGVRLWVDSNLIIDKWQTQSATEWSGTADLAANQKYDIEMQYFEDTGEAIAQLKWSSASQTKEVVPQGRLFTAHPPGDLDDDYCVDLEDLEILSDQWLTTGPEGDIDESTSVDFADMAIMGSGWEE
jgi:hypothetical protein